MGYKFEFNWALKLKPEEGFPEELKKNNIYNFHKKESRIYPLGCNLQLINQDWEVIGDIQILEFKVDEKKTEGRFKLVKIYNEEEKKILTRIAKENSEIMKKKGYVTK